MCFPQHVSLFLMEKKKTVHNEYSHTSCCHFYDFNKWRGLHRSHSCTTKKTKKKSLNFFQIVPETIWITTTGPTVRSRGWVLRVVLVLAYCYWYRWPKSKDYTYLKNSQILIYKSRFSSYYICKGGFSCLRMLQRCFAIKLQKCFVDNKTSSDLPSLWRWVDNDSTCIFGWPVHLNSSTSNTHQTQNMLEIKSHEKLCRTRSACQYRVRSSRLCLILHNNQHGLNPYVEFTVEPRYSSQEHLFQTNSRLSTIYLPHSTAGERPLGPL